MSVPLKAMNALQAGRAAEQPLRVGMIGLDISHAPAFTQIFHREAALGVHVVAGYPGGTDLPVSRDRIAAFTEEVRQLGVEIIPTLIELLEHVDAVLLTSVDGRVHLQEAAAVIAAGKPLFIDKPLAGSLVDAMVIDDLARRGGVPYFSSSALRFCPASQTLLTSGAVGEIVGAVTWGACSYQSGIPDLFFYGIHGIELLYTFMGSGCQTLTRLQTSDTDVVTGHWHDGRVGTYRGIRRHHAEFGATVFGAQAIMTVGWDGDYAPLCRAIARFFRTAVPPVEPETTLELLAFMEAADESRNRGGQPVSIAETFAAARQQAAARLVAWT